MVSPPSAFRRGLRALALLVAFYVTTLVLSFALFASGVGICYLMTRGEKILPVAFIVIIFGTWMPGFLLLRAIFKGPSRARIPFPRLTRDQAPGFFVLLDDIAARAGTRPPDDVYLSPLSELGVTERGGFLFIGSRRVLIIGATLITALDVQELRAGLAHEMGHYLGGETRLAGVTSFTHGLFRAILTGTPRPTQFLYWNMGVDAARWVGLRVASLYARIFLAMTRPTDRQLEHAADVFSVTHAGTAAAKRALEKVGINAALVEAHWSTEIAAVIDDGAVPADYVQGFLRFCARVEERGLTKEIGGKLREEKSDRFDTHPSLMERLSFIDSLPVSVLDEDRRAASSLFVDLDGLGHAAMRCLLVAPETMLVLPWADIPPRVLEPATHRRAREMAAMIHHFPPGTPLPHIFAFVVEQLGAGGGHALMISIEPEFRFLSPAVAAERLPLLATLVLTRLFAGALLERGGRIVFTNGEGTDFEIHGTRVSPTELALAAKDSAEGLGALREWSRRLAA